MARGVSSARAVGSALRADPLRDAGALVYSSRLHWRRIGLSQLTQANAARLGRPLPPVSPQKFVTRPAPALTQGLHLPAADRTRLGRLFLAGKTMPHRLQLPQRLQPAIDRHVAAAAKDLDVLSRVVARVSVDVVAIGTGLGAALTGTQGQPLPDAIPLCRRQGSGALPVVGSFATHALVAARTTTRFVAWFLGFAADRAGRHGGPPGTHSSQSLRKAPVAWSISSTISLVECHVEHPSQHSGGSHPSSSPRACNWLATAKRSTP